MAILITRHFAGCVKVCFDDIYVLDLHGNSKKKEKCPDGSKDENVFDIQQGVAISIFVKGQNKQNAKKQPANVYHADLYGLRDCKYEWLKENNFTKTEWTKLKPQSEFYLFVPQNTDLEGEYKQGWKVTDIFPVNSVGIVTGQDKKTIAFTCKQAEVLADGQNLSNNTVNPILYRPFDKRFIVYDSKVVARPRGDLMRHMLVEENLGLISSRQQSQQSEWSLCGVTNSIIESCVVSNKTREINYLFPLYLYPNPNNPKELEESVRPNLSPKFLKDITSKLDYTPTPEAIFYYIYAIFHSPTYRDRYAEFLKIDFPRVPLTSSDKLFQQLSAYGEELVPLHLMKSPKLNNPITQFVENGGGKEVAIGSANKAYANNKVTINKKGDGFTGVPEEVWNFHVG
ncbi:MAG: type ISP restriction/modification enzyme, partial [Cyanobacteria bacterium J06639_18]